MIYANIYHLYAFTYKNNRKNQYYTLTGIKSTN